MFDFDVRSGHDPGESEMLSNLLRVPALREEFSQPIARIARRPSVVVAPATALQDTLDLMSNQRVSVALVGSHGVLLGTLTEREMIRHLLADPPITAQSPVWRIMVTEPETLLEDDTLAYAAQKLWTLGVRAMPLVRRDGSLGGLLDTHDIVTWLCDRMGAGGVPRIGHG